MSASDAAVLQPVRVRRRVRRLSAGDVGLIVFASVLALFTLLASWPGLVASHDPTLQNLVDRHRPPGYTDGTGAAYLLGTDHLGRDVVSRLVYGARASLIIGYGGLLLGAGAGVLVGLLAGYHGGRVDRIVVGVIDTYLSFSYILLAIVWASLVG